MPAEISRISRDGKGVDEIMYVGKTPWHGLGQYVGDKEVTAAEAIKAASLDWTVSKRPAFFQTSKGTFQDNGGFTIVRNDTEHPLGRVGNTYTPLQNTEAFKFMDDLIGKDRAAYHTAGALQHGKKIWILVKVGNGEGQADITPGDTVENFVLLSNGHDGGTSLDIMQTNVRVVCQNTLNMALNQKEKGKFFSFRHTKSITEKSAVAREGLMAVNDKFKKFVEAGRLLAGEQITRTELDDFLIRLELHRANEREANPEAVKDFFRTEKYAAMVGAFENAPGAKQAGTTLWGALNAVTYYTDHMATTRNANSGNYSGETDARLNSAWFGTGAERKERALALALEFAGKR